MALWHQTSPNAAAGHASWVDVEAQAAHGARSLEPLPYAADGEAAADQLVHRFPDRLDVILANARRQYTQPVLRLGDEMSRHWVNRRDIPYRHEIERVAAALGRSGAWMLNLSYEWGCTTAAVTEPNGSPRLLRTLDWQMPGLGRAAVAARWNGDAGPYVNLTWPGFVGVVQAIAPGRFAASINQAPSCNTGLGLIGDWVATKWAFWKSQALPPVLLLRLAFDRCRTFADAKTLLAETPVCAPVIFGLVGCQPEETALIERSAEESIVHDHLSAVTNHWLNQRLAGIARSFRSEDRLDAMRAHLRDRYPDASPFAWLSPPILNNQTRMAMEMVPATGEILVQGYEPDGAVTAITRLAA